MRRDGSLHQAIRHSRRMRIVRLKKGSQRIWRIVDAKDRVLGRKIADVWPERELRIQRTEAQSRYIQICNAVKVIANGIDEKGFLFLLEGHAEVALEVMRLCTGWKPVPSWAVYAIANGWRMPRDWSPDHSCGDTVMPRVYLEAWLKKRSS